MEIGNENSLRLNKEILREKIKALLFGIAVGDALGVPVEFLNRAYLQKNRLQI